MIKPTHPSRRKNRYRRKNSVGALATCAKRLLP